jgi:hypothetical protein
MSDDEISNSESLYGLRAPYFYFMTILFPILNDDILGCHNVLQFGNCLFSIFSIVFKRWKNV